MLDPRLIIAIILILGSAIFAAFAEQLGVSAAGIGGIGVAVSTACAWLGYGTPNSEHRALLEERKEQ